MRKNYFFLCLPFNLFLFISFGVAHASILGVSESNEASETIAKWYLKTYSHYDFISATPIGRTRSSWTHAQPLPVSIASECGFSRMQVPLSEDFKEAYEALGIDTSLFPETVEVNRFHAAWGVRDYFDVGFSYLHELTSGVAGWGGGVKFILINSHPFYLSSRAQYSTAQRDELFNFESYGIDLSASLNFNRIDFFGGLKYQTGKVNFESGNDYLEFDEIESTADIESPEYFYGLTFGVSDSIRTTIQWNQVGDEYAVVGKLSFKSSAAIPMFPWAGGRDPHY